MYGFRSQLGIGCLIAAILISLQLTHATEITNQPAEEKCTCQNDDGLLKQQFNDCNNSTAAPDCKEASEAECPAQKECKRECAANCSAENALEASSAAADEKDQKNLAKRCCCCCCKPCCCCRCCCCRPCCCCCCRPCCCCRCCCCRPCCCRCCCCRPCCCCCNRCCCCCPCCCCGGGGHGRRRRSVGGAAPCKPNVCNFAPRVLSKTIVKSDAFGVIGACETCATGYAPVALSAPKAPEDKALPSRVRRQMMGGPDAGPGPNGGGGPSFDDDDFSGADD